MNKFFNLKNFFSGIKSNKKMQIILIVIAVLIIIAFCVTYNFNDNKESVNNLEEDYVTLLENKLSKTLSLVEGAGTVSVVITVESGIKTVIATKKVTTESGGNKEVVETPVLVNGKTVTLREEFPNIIGVLIVAKGAKNISVMSRIQQATMSLLNVNINQIEILTMK